MRSNCCSNDAPDREPSVEQQPNRVANSRAGRQTQRDLGIQTARLEVEADGGIISDQSVDRPRQGRGVRRPAGAAQGGGKQQDDAGSHHDPAGYFIGCR